MYAQALMNENKKIAKNSLILYIRLIITTVIGLYTSRVVLLQLGADDYGLYAVVGGIVLMMNFLGPTMLATSYRYIAIEIGKGENGDTNKVFNTSLVIHLFLALVFILIAETIGVWYIHNYFNVAAEKIPDAIFVLHFSVLATVFSITSTPFQGLITANEKFLARVTIEIIRAVLKLGFVLLLVLYIGNKLQAYAIIMTIIMVIPAILFVIYCKVNNKDVGKWKLIRVKSDYWDMFKFSGWIMIGAIAHMGVRQGAAVIINLFFGTILNAAFGIATQVNNYIMMFVKNLNQAAVPQIMKSHSSGDSERSLNLVYYISKYAFFVMLLPAIPIMLSIDSILVLWLKEVPEYTKQFAILMIINGLIGCTASGFDAAIQSTGKIRKPQIWYSTIMLLTLPIAYLLFKLNYPPYIITVITIGATITNLIVQMKILTKITKFKIIHYLSHTIYPVFIVSIVTLPQIFLRSLFGQNITGVLIFSIISVSLILLTIYIVGLNRNERNTINIQLKKLKINHINATNN